MPLIMATGFSRTLEGGSEPVIDFPCTPCSREGRNVEAHKYCVNCCDYMCSKCLKDHNKFAPLRAHRMLEGAAMKTQGQQDKPYFPSERCEVHHGELINMFCPTHDVVCCSVCIALDHRPCTDVTYLPKAAKGVNNSQEYKEIKDGMEQILTKLRKLKIAKQNDRVGIDKQKQDVEKTIKNFREKVNAIFDDLEKTTTDLLDDKYKEVTDKLGTDIDSIEESISIMETNLKQLEIIKQENESEIFVAMKKSKTALGDGHEIIKSTDSTEIIQFNIDQKIEEYFKGLNSLGEFLESDQSGASPYKYVCTQSEQKSSQGHLYSAKLHAEVNVRVKKDKQTCSIYDICQLDDGTILVVDSENENIKRLDSSYAVSDYCPLSGSPWSVCCTGAKEVALSLYVKQQIQFVSVGSKLKTTRSFSVGMFCRGITYNSGELYICCGDNCNNNSQVRVYNTAGKLLTTIMTDPSGNSIFSMPQHITTRRDGTVIYIADDNNVIITLDSNRQVLSTLSDPQLDYTAGVCVDNKGQLLVCGYTFNNVLQFDCHGNRLGVILMQDDGIEKPLSICYDDSHSRLIVSMYKSNTHKVFDLVWETTQIDI